MPLDELAQRLAFRRREVSARRLPLPRFEQFEAAPTMPLDPHGATGDNPLIAAIKATYRKEP